MSVHVTDFISRLVVHFGEPKFDVSDTDKVKAHRMWLKDTVENLRGFSHAELIKGAELIISTRKHRNFPMLFECKQACIEAKQRLDREKPKLFDGGQNKALPQWSEDRIKLADELVMGPLGREAARDGWILSLHDYCRKNLSLPMGHDILACKRGAAGFDEAYAKLTRETSTPVTRSVIRLGDQMMARREQLRAMVLEGVIR